MERGPEDGEDERAERGEDEREAGSLPPGRPDGFSAHARKALPNFQIFPNDQIGGRQGIPTRKHEGDEGREEEKFATSWIAARGSETAR